MQHAPILRGLVLYACIALAACWCKCGLSSVISGASTLLGYPLARTAYSEVLEAVPIDRGSLKVCFGCYRIIASSPGMGELLVHSKEGRPIIFSSIRTKNVGARAHIELLKNGAINLKWVGKMEGVPSKYTCDVGHFNVKDRYRALVEQAAAGDRPDALHSLADALKNRGVSAQGSNGDLSKSAPKASTHTVKNEPGNDAQRHDPQEEPRSDTPHPPAQQAAPARKSRKVLAIGLILFALVLVVSGYALVKYRDTDPDEPEKVAVRERETVAHASMRARY